MAFITKKTYKEKLLDPRWQQKKNKILERDNYTCQHCGDTKTTLHVHHFYYINGGDPWDVDDTGLNTYCECCHSLEECMSSKFPELDIIEVIKRKTDSVNLIVFASSSTNYYFMIFGYFGRNAELLISITMDTFRAMQSTFTKWSEMINKYEPENKNNGK